MNIFFRILLYFYLFIKGYKYNYSGLWLPNYPLPMYLPGLVSNELVFVSSLIQFIAFLNWSISLFLINYYYEICDHLKVYFVSKKFFYIFIIYIVSCFKENSKISVQLLFNLFRGKICKSFWLKIPLGKIFLLCHLKQSGFKKLM